MKYKKPPKDFTLRQIVVQLFGHEPGGDITSKEERECLDVLFNFLFVYQHYGLRAWLDGSSNAGEELEKFKDTVFPTKEVSTAGETYVRDKFYELSTHIKINRDDWLAFIALDHRKYADDYLRNQLQDLDTIIAELQEDKPEHIISDIISGRVNFVVKKNSDEHINRLESVKKEREIKEELVQSIINGIRWGKIEWIKGQYRKNPFWTSADRLPHNPTSTRSKMNYLREKVKAVAITIQKKSNKNETVPQIADHSKIKNSINHAQKSSEDGPGLPDNKPSHRTLERWIRDALQKANLSSKAGRPPKHS